MPRRLLAVLLLLAPLAHAQPVFPSGGAIGLEMPPGWRPAPGFQGFVGPGGASVLVAEMPAEAFPQLAAGMTPERLATTGFRESSRRPFAVAGREGVLLTGRQRQGARDLDRLLLVFPAEGLTGLVTVNLPDASPAALREAEAALGTVTLRVATPEARRAALPFTFEETAGLRLRDVSAGSGVSLAPPDAARGAAEPTMIIAAALGDAPAVTPARRSAAATAALLGLRQYRDVRITATEERVVAGQDGIVIAAEAVDATTGAPLRLMQWIAFPPGAGSTLRAVAEAPAATFDAALPEFERVVASLRRP